MFAVLAPGDDATKVGPHRIVRRVAVSRAGIVKGAIEIVRELGRIGAHQIDNVPTIGFGRRHARQNAIIERNQSEFWFRTWPANLLNSRSEKALEQGHR
jgi:hypothetical protein